MGRICKEKSSKSSQVMKRCKKLNTECKGCSPHFCRNPFMVFLEHFRKNRKCPLSAYRSAAVAGKMWNNMNIIARAPYIKFARTYQYTFKPKRKKVNYVVNKIRHLVETDKLDLHSLWRLCGRMGSWNDCIMDSVFTLDDEMNDFSDSDCR